jgi:nucleoside 2-deoxyribosyltransferase
MSEMDKYCPICLSPGAALPRESGQESGTAFNCLRCGRFHMTSRVIELAQQCLDQETCNHDVCLGPGIAMGRGRKRANASSWLRETGGVSLRALEDFERLTEVPTPPFSQRAERLMIALESLTRFAGEDLRILGGENEWDLNLPILSRCWCLNEDELFEVAQFLVSCGRIVASQDLMESRVVVGHIAPAGWAYLEDLKYRPAVKDQGFVAMSFAHERREIFDKAIAPAIEDTGYQPIRIDDVEHVGLIDDRIVAEVRRSRLVVADFTDQRPNVYFEAGFALGLNTPVFWTCHEIPEDAPKEAQLHFDTSHFNFIMWSDLDELKVRLQRRIEAVIGRGSYVRLAATPG